ncbi:MAG: response regulator [Burkholderiaceae bacterium]|jgi:CheY-like chemotaxis protein
MVARILLIDDTPEVLDLFVYILTAAGYVTLAARDGLQGLALARAEQPDLILCDNRMPVSDGYAVARELKSDPALRHIPLISTTAAAMAGDRARILEAGFDGYIAKPIEPERFADQVAAFLPIELRQSKPTST